MNSFFCDNLYIQPELKISKNVLEIPQNIETKSQSLTKISSKSCWRYYDYHFLILFTFHINCYSDLYDLIYASEREMN
jgi:hypothetical protein